MNKKKSAKRTKSTTRALLQSDHRKLIVMLYAYHCEQHPMHFVHDSWSTTKEVPQVTFYFKKKKKRKGGIGVWSAKLICSRLYRVYITHLVFLKWGSVQGRLEKIGLYFYSKILVYIIYMLTKGWYTILFFLFHVNLRVTRYLL